jgi:hypothetical protein
MHLGLYCTGHLCTALLVSSVNSRGAPCQSSVMTSVSGGGKLGRQMADRFCFGTQLPCNPKGLLVCRKSATRGKWLYFPSEGRHAEDCYAWKIPMAEAAVNQLRKGFQPCLNACKDDSWKLIEGDIKILMHWVRYFKTQFEGENSEEVSVSNSWTPSEGTIPGRDGESYL